jgi:CheY-like chemotaxis protein/DNA-directed RNA polymerase specialized sigma24 family protein
MSSGQSLGHQVAGQLPFLRRYARALTGSQARGDAHVRALLERALTDSAVRTQISEGRIGLYRAFSQIWASRAGEVAATGAPASEHEAGAQARLATITTPARQALLLTTLEEFSAAQAAEILGLGADELAALVAEAVAEIEREQATSVLIIEDEPLISMQLEDLVGGLGHTIFGTAATRTQALEVMGDAVPGLVLADIQLADGSSGLDAVDDILAIASVPVIFITAYPERLLTGDRPEPTYLVTKPFQEATVRAAISQALFFGSSRPL